MASSRRANLTIPGLPVILINPQLLIGSFPLVWTGPSNAIPVPIPSAGALAQIPVHCQTLHLDQGGWASSEGLTFSCLR